MPTTPATSPAQGDLRLLDAPVARDLLGRAIPARMAYIDRAGEPRIVPTWFHWTGEEVVMPTWRSGPHIRHPARRLRDLAEHPKVAISIDTEDQPPVVLQIRGRPRSTRSTAWRTSTAGPRGGTSARRRPVSSSPSSTGFPSAWPASSCAPSGWASSTSPNACPGRSGAWSAPADGRRPRSPAPLRRLSADRGRGSTIRDAETSAGLLEGQPMTLTATGLPPSEIEG